MTRFLLTHIQMTSISVPCWVPESHLRKLLLVWAVESRSLSDDGNAGRVMFVKDDLNTTPTLSTGTLAESSMGTKNTVSGIRHYNTGGKDNSDPEWS